MASSSVSATMQSTMIGQRHVADLPAAGGLPVAERGGLLLEVADGGAQGQQAELAHDGGAVRAPDGAVEVDPFAVWGSGSHPDPLRDAQILALVAEGLAGQRQSRGSPRSP